MLHLNVMKVQTPDEMGKAAADEFEAVIKRKPACVLGLLLHSQIKSLFTPSMVLIPFVIGALLMIFVERRKFKPSYITLDDMTPKLALGIGCFQCLALWPGFSRSASTARWAARSLRCVPTRAMTSSF